MSRRGRAGGAERGYRGLSLWLDRLDGPLIARPALPGDLTCDVAIVGAGFTGLWTAYYLQRADPGIRIVLLEREIAGFGASGRNGGWCSELFPASWDKIARRRGRQAALAMKAAMRAGLDEVESVISAEQIECGWARGGTIGFARSDVQLERAQAEVAHGHLWGDTDDDLRLLSPVQAREIACAEGVLGATFTPHCASMDPAALVRRLATIVTARGAQLYEDTAVQEILPRRVVTQNGTVTADVVVRATEGYTAALPGARRDLVPIYSLIVATEPLDQATLAAVGLADRPTFSDHRHVICYGQRTADGRIVFGGRGAPYHYGSATAAEFDREPKVFESLQRNLIGMFPALADVTFTHSWGGPLGVPRDWHAGVGLGPGHRLRLGRWLRRRRGRHGESGRPHAGRPDHPDAVRDRRAALGRTPIPQVGAGATALPRGQHRPTGDGFRRSTRDQDRSTFLDGKGLRPLPGRLSGSGPCAGGSEPALQDLRPRRPRRGAAPISLAIAARSGWAFAIATPNPAQCSISRSLGMSPKAMTSAASMPHCCASPASAQPLLTPAAATSINPSSVE